MGLVTRHAYNQVPKTLTYGTPDTISVPAGNFNAIQMLLNGTVTATSGADAEHGTKCAINLVTFRSQKQGIIAVLNGVELYYISLMFGVAPPTVDSGSGGGAAKSMYCIPICVDREDTLYIDVTWNTLATFHSTATAYSGVLSVVPDFIPDFPMVAVKYRRKDLGAGGVVGANATAVEIPQVLAGFDLFGFMAIQNTSAKGTLTDAFSDYQLEHHHGYPIGQPLDALHLRYITSREDHLAHVTGIDIQRFAPIHNNEGTQLTITNGATATVDLTSIVWFYVSQNVSGFIYDKGSSGFTKSYGIQPDMVAVNLTGEGKIADYHSHTYPFKAGQTYDADKYSKSWALAPRKSQVSTLGGYDNHFGRFGG